MPKRQYLKFLYGHFDIGYWDLIRLIRLIIMPEADVRPEDSAPRDPPQAEKLE